MGLHADRRISADVPRVFAAEQGPKTRRDEHGVCVRTPVSVAIRERGGGMQAAGAAPAPTASATAAPSGRGGTGLDMGGEEDFDLHIKLLMLGDSGVGKTCLLLRYAEDTFSSVFITTIGIDFKIKRLSIDDMRIKLQIWDTAGQERFRTITVSYFKGAHGIVLVYDVTDRDTFENIRNWVQQIRTHADSNVNLVLVGNKCDIEDARVVDTEEGRALAEEFNVPFFETSAKTRVNIDECYYAIAKATKDRLIEQETTQSIDLQPGTQESKCCS